MRRAANSFSMLADAVLEELPSTMAAMRLSGMEISDLTLELSDLRSENNMGVSYLFHEITECRVHYSIPFQRGKTLSILLVVHQFYCWKSELLKDPTYSATLLF